MFAPKGSELEILLTNADKYCCCPLHRNIKELDLRNKNFVYNTCSETRPLPKMDLIRHLHDKAYNHGDIHHYAALIYVKHLYGLSQYTFFNIAIDNMDQKSMYRPNTFDICHDKEDSDNHSKKEVNIEQS